MSFNRMWKRVKNFQENLSEGFIRNDQKEIQVVGLLK
jgi:hypothetical protein